MKYTEHRPVAPLAEHLECLWFVADDDASPMTRASERVLPDCCLEWIFHLGAPFRRWTPIMRSHGQTRVDQLAGRIGWSPRQLEREFRASAGLSPKALARIIRFQNILRLVGESSLRQWASLALEGGYADQSHMVY